MRHLKDSFDGCMAWYELKCAAKNISSCGATIP